MFSRLIRQVSRRTSRLMAKQAAKTVKATTKATRDAVRHGNKAVQQTAKAARTTRRALKAIEAEQVHRPPGRFVEVDGLRVHYIARAQGRPVVLIHGNGTMAEDFVISGLVDQLATRYRVAWVRPYRPATLADLARVCSSPPCPSRSGAPECRAAAHRRPLLGHARRARAGSRRLA